MRLLLLLFTISMVSCSKTNVELPSRELEGVYENYKTKITFGDGSVKVFSVEDNTMQSYLYDFTQDSVYIYVLQDGEYIPPQEGLYCEWYRDQLLKVGCRQVIAYSSNHITWKQNDWLITKYFK